jgi:hypothetical protein
MEPSDHTADSFPCQFKLQRRLRIWQGLSTLVFALFLVFFVRVATRPGQPRIFIDPQERGVSSWRKAECRTPDSNRQLHDYYTACTDGFWEHIWDGIQYCADGRDDCRGVGGTWVEQLY